MQGKLYLVPTPIGNLEDITLRAIRILKEVDLIFAEDTRKSGILLKHYEIDTPAESFHMHNEHKKQERLVQLINEGKNIALISDAGTPGISDPGFLAVRTCINEGIKVESLPGATAFIPALVNSAFPCDRFVFEGFLPQKKGRNKRLEALKTESRAIVFYESPYRLVKTLEQLAEFFSPEYHVSVSRELTKIHEENIRGKLTEVINHYKEKPPKGEIVIIFWPKDEK